jgi:hypothetical protein
LSYQEKFCYVGSNKTEREKLIEDGIPNSTDENGELTELAMAYRYEQSDMAVVLLNLAMIPDEVLRKIDFNPGWQKRFKNNMEMYKNDFTKQNKGSEWKF